MKLVLYKPEAKADLLLLDFWNKLLMSQELAQIFTPEAQRLSGFFHSFQWPTQLLYDKAESGIELAAWFSPTEMDAAFYGFWVTPPRRHMRESLYLLFESLDWGLERWPVLISVTRNEGLAQQIERVGFDRGMIVPQIFAGEDAFVSFITRDLYTKVATKYQDVVVHA